MAKKILGIVGSYRKGGITDVLVSETLAAARDLGAQTEIVYLIDTHIEFCTNCRACTQPPGEEPGRCVHQDDLAALLEMWRTCDGLVIGSPVNFYNITAITRRFMERLICFAYWPWNQGGPRMRRPTLTRKAVLITSTAMPGILGRFFTGGLKALRLIAKTLGAKPVATILVGLIAQDPHAKPPERALRQARAAGRKLVEG
jgi:NAD(P)H-dependent FMN reductase